MKDEIKPRVMRKSYGNDTIYYIGGFGPKKWAAEEALSRIQFFDRVVAAIEYSIANCRCTMKERLSGHHVDCHVLNLENALADIRPISK